ncbi:MAG: GyrI-like domain-containing protein [Dehalococcoidia bacterium]|nr:GyrI-like domain-containing protein [Dehalococcoidia bacterium]
MSHDPQIVDLPAMVLAGVRCDGDAAGGEEHWRRFRAWLAAQDFVPSDDVLAVAYTPPLAFGAGRSVELCAPVAAAQPGDAPEGRVAGADVVVTRTLAGRFVLAAGAPQDVPALVRSARHFAAAHGLAFERGSVVIYRRTGGEAVRADAGVRIHD